MRFIQGKCIVGNQRVILIDSLFWRESLHGLDQNHGLRWWGKWRKPLTGVILNVCFSVTYVMQGTCLVLTSFFMLSSYQVSWKLRNFRESNTCIIFWCQFLFLASFIVDFKIQFFKLLLPKNWNHFRRMAVLIKHFEKRQSAFVTNFEKKKCVDLTRFGFIFSECVVTKTLYISQILLC